MKNLLTSPDSSSRMSQAARSSHARSITGADCLPLRSIDEPTRPGFLPPPPLEGRIIGRYLVSRELGKGGMGSVYAAFDIHLERQVALKVVRHAGHARLRARLLDEARIMSRVVHPNVVAVHDAGVQLVAECDELVFIAMELVDGPSLRDWLDARLRPWQEVLDAFVAAGRGLAAVHEAGLVHGDVKPQNILVGGDGHVRLADFGLARDALASSGRSSPARLLGEKEGAVRRVLGTPAYMSPEQRYDSELSALADQYSFCLSLWEALWGTRPVDAVPVSGPFHVASGCVPPTLVPILGRGIDLDPARRYASMDELLGELSQGS